ncbi:MAG: glycosyltransferase family 2 protein [Proteiniphilum sp.]|nr:glycosyltransferase family 2 protein [Proteiniphilum sp.]MDD3908709.1 glycosyltransferase family 2 protein [Proteiniphilum sp.]MDD4415241.1 glycosyltransferase family 2 protein [Proteiniphilum sp.]
MLISVVTVCFNAQKVIEKTIKSVIDQNFSDKEYIVIDGSSSDSTLEIIEKYRDSIDILVSEKDDGIYHAMNKAVNKASGDWVIFMNAGDIFANANVLEYVSGFLKMPADVYYGNILTERDGSHILKEAPSEIKNIHRMPFCHQAVFTRTSQLKKYPFDEKYRLSSDFKFYKKLILDKVIFKKIDIPIAVYDKSGLSHTQRVNGLSENIAIVMELDDFKTKLKLLPRLFFVKYWNQLRIKKH